jgi:hypothetical protein
MFDTGSAPVGECRLDFNYGGGGDGHGDGCTFGSGNGGNGRPDGNGYGDGYDGTGYLILACTDLYELDACVINATVRGEYGLGTV